MEKRKLRFVKRTAPSIGICERCNSQFKSNKPAEEAMDIVYAFAKHTCEPLDSGQNALRIVREAAEGK